MSGTIPSKQAWVSVGTIHLSGHRRKMSFSTDAETGFDGKVLRIQTVCQVGKRVSLATVGTGACIKKDMLATALHCFFDADKEVQCYASGHLLKVVAKGEDRDLVQAQAEGGTFLVYSALDTKSTLASHVIFSAKSLCIISFLRFANTYLQTSLRILIQLQISTIAGQLFSEPFELSQGEVLYREKVTCLSFPAVRDQELRTEVTAYHIKGLTEPSRQCVERAPPAPFLSTYTIACLDSRYLACASYFGESPSKFYEVCWLACYTVCLTFLDQWQRSPIFLVKLVIRTSCMPAQHSHALTANYHS